MFIQLIMLYSIYGFIRGILNKHTYSIYFAIGALLSLYIVNEQIQIVFGKSRLNLSLLVVQMIWSILHALLISVRISKTFALVEAQTKELVLMDKFKDDFLAKTSHEFKTPLHGIINIIKLFVEKEKKYLPADEIESLELVIDIANRLSRLVNDILEDRKSVV